MSSRRSRWLLWIVCRHECRVLWRDASTAIVLVAIMASMAFGLWSGARWAAFQGEAVEAGIQREAEVFRELESQARDWESRGAEASPEAFPLHPGYIGLFYSRFAALPPAVTAPLSIGQSAMRPYYFWVNGERRDSWLDQEEIDNPQNLLAGRFDLGFVVVFFLPIVALGLSFDLLSREREQGTLQLIGSQPIPTGVLLAGKIVARWALVMGSVLLVMVPAALGLGIFQGAPGAFLLWIGAVGGYVLFWILLAGVVNTRTRDSASNGILLLSAWLLLGVILPPVLNRVVASVHPLPPRAEVIQTTRALETEVRVDPGTLVETYYADQPELRPEGFDPDRYNFPLFWTAIQREVDEGMESLLRQEREALEGQERLGRRLAALSPAVLVQMLSDAVAGTDLGRNRRFLEEVFDFHSEHRAFFEPRTFGHQTLKADEYAHMPTFHPRAAGLRLDATQAVPLGVLSLLWSLVAGILLWRRCRRLDPG